jgi:hypothetical protein
MSLTETIKELGSDFVIQQGEYDLTADAMRLRSQRPLHCGDDYTFNFTAYESDGETEKDLSGATITFTAKYDVADADGYAIVQKSGTLVDAPNGQFKVELADSDVAGPEFIRGYYDLQITIAGETVTWLYGDIEFLPNVTQATP